MVEEFEKGLSDFDSVVLEGGTDMGEEKCQVAEGRNLRRCEWYEIEVGERGDRGENSSGPSMSSTRLSLNTVMTLTSIRPR